MRRNEAGLTMVEIGIILVILAILAAAFAPTMGNILSVLKTKGASEEVAMAIRRARQLAITQAVDHCISFPGGNQYKISTPTCGDPAIADGGLMTLSQGATVSDASQTFAFTPIGVTTAGTVTITITDPSACLTVTVAGGVQLGSPPC